MAVAFGGMIALPAWASRWNATSVTAGLSLLSALETELLAELSETIIPVTDTPGAKELKVDAFIQKMVADCLDKKSQETFTKGLATVDSLAQQKFAKAFVGCDTNQRMNVLKEMETSADATTKDFYATVKGLTIQGYLTSEYVMTNLTHYEMVPSRYHGCVPVSSK